MKTTHPTPTTPQMGDMINLEGMNQYDLQRVSRIMHDCGAIAYESIIPSLSSGYWLCWTENNTLELGDESEHVECLSEANIDNRVLVLNENWNLCEKPPSTTASTRTAYSDNINYYKRMIQQGTCAINHLTEQEAHQKLGYWEGRFDELTTGGWE